jgi:hypothetical protein
MRQATGENEEDRWLVSLRLYTGFLCSNTNLRSPKVGYGREK